MTRFFDENRRESTIRRDNYVLDVYDSVILELGELSHFVSRTYIYEKVREKTGFCAKTIERIINHARRD